MTKKGHVSRRKVAAISFLSNIKVEGETEDDLPGYRCLQGSQVLEQYRRQSRMRRKVPYKKGAAGGRKKEQGVSSRERTPEQVDAVNRRVAGGESFKKRPAENRARCQPSIESHDHNSTVTI